MVGLNKFSSRITQPKSQGASQAMLFATGLSNEDMSKPQVGIASVWLEGNPCNMHLLELSEKVKEGVVNSGMVGFRFNTIGVSDAISVGTEGMSFSLQSRDLIADSVETVMSAQWYDALIALPGCDKNMPGVLMGMGRLNRPSLMVYGGSIKPGKSKLSNKPLDVVSALRSYGDYSSGLITEEERVDIIKHACPGPGAAGGMYTANTMASAIEALGMSLPYSSSTLAEDNRKIEECKKAGNAIRNLLEADIKPKDIMTRLSFENAIAVVCVLGGSTNAVLHLIAIARSVGITLTLEYFQKVSDRVPLLADLRPSGQYVMEDLHKVGGVPAVMKYMLEEGLIDGTCLTVTGKTVEENLSSVLEINTSQRVIMPIDSPIKNTGLIQILYGNLAPQGCVAKITGQEGLQFSGPAICFDREEDMVEAVLNRSDECKGKVIVIRYEGPKGGPGMPEMLSPTSVIKSAGLGKECALITDGRFSGGSSGFVIGHITPEAQVGGPIALLHNGDLVTIDVEQKFVSAHITPDELQKRKSTWQPPPLKAQAGTLYKYIKNVESASLGCITDL